MFFDFFTRSYQSKEYIDTINELQHVPALIEIDDPPEEAEPDCEAAEEIEADYAPPALTAETVERLFHACLAREGDTDIAGRVSPFRKVNGYPSDFKSYLFDRLQLLARQRDIRYLLGQVQAIAQGQRSVPVGAFRTDYRAACGRTAPPTPSTLSTWPTPWSGSGISSCRRRAPVGRVRPAS